MQRFLGLTIGKTKLSIFLAFVLVASVGCGGGGVNMRPTLTAKTQLQANQGIVVARVVNTSAYPLPFNQLTVNPENLNESKKIKPERLLSLETDKRGVTVYSAPLQQGTYALSSIRSFHSNGNYWYSRFIGSDAKFGTFDVKPGQVTDLGTIIYYQKPQEDKYFETLARLPEPILGEVLKKYFPFYAYEEDQILTWNDDGNEEERESLYVSIAQNPISFDKQYLAPDNSLYFLGKLGVLIKRTKEGLWETDAVDTNLNLNTIAQNKKGALFVGGSEGKLFYKPVGKAWQDISLDHGDQISHLQFHNENMIDILVQRDQELRVFRASINTDNLDWQEINQYTQVDGWKKIAELQETTKQPITNKNIKVRPKKIVKVKLAQLDNTSYLSIHSLPINANPIFSKSDVKVFGYRPDTWEIFTPEKELEVNAVINAGATKLGITEPGFWSWDNKPTYSRFDKELGQWMEISTSINVCPNGEINQQKLCMEKNKKVKSKRQNFSFQAVPLFKSNLEAIAIAHIPGSAAGSDKSAPNIKILLTEDGGKNWRETSGNLPNKFCSKLVPEISDRLLISCDGYTGDFYESLDQGETWLHVRQQENF